MNNVVLMGRLTKEPDTRSFNSNNSELKVARFTLAVDRRFKREGEATADFISCVAFGKTGELIELYCHKGDKICISGRIQTGSYTNKDGNKVYTTDVVAESVEFTGKKENGADAALPNTDDFVAVPDNLEKEGLPFA